MANLHISDELDAELERAAGLLGRTKDSLAEEAISARLEEHLASETNFTEEEIAKLRRGLDQLNRGEGVPGEEIEAMFEDWRRQRNSR
jgi:predicted transcriptional regulator